MQQILQALVILSIFLEPVFGKRHHVFSSNSKNDDCMEPPDLHDLLADWLQISLQSSHENIDEQIIDNSPSFPNSKNPPEICEKSPKLGETLMERALCPWESRVNFEETREPKILVESVCLCRTSRGTIGAFCMPILRNHPVLRRVSCDSKTKYWKYSRSWQMIVVGCHSVLPRTRKMTRLVFSV
ncbi:unnamed protein product [Caenorhabditis angaria]|uniref:Uncharacterized protein n=1 Tax=Caenorhabditis angaria TaxID=860376 RepID=A0A9P1N9R8_9PELO|nr:unnamed protein product [Caenorhabditis angaria]